MTSDIKSIFDVLDQVSVTATEAELRTNKLNDGQISLSENVQNQDEQISGINSELVKLAEELKSFDGRSGDANSKDVPWDVLTSVMRFFHDRNDADRELLSKSTVEDDKISGKQNEEFLFSYTKLVFKL